jgi:hypothetical protein
MASSVPAECGHTAPLDAPRLGLWLDGYGTPLAT